VPELTSLEPVRVVEGGRLWLRGDGFPSLTMSTGDVAVIVPEGTGGGELPVKAEWLPGATLFVNVGTRLATGLHQVDNPVFDRHGFLYVTYSGTRGQQAAVSIFRVTPGGAREAYVTGLVNPTSMALGPDGHLYVTSRFEGRVYRVEDDGRYEVVASDLGIACGLAFAADGTLFVGDRSGTIFRIEPGGKTSVFAALPASVAAFHLAIDAAGMLFVSAPTLASYDYVRRVDPSGRVDTLPTVFGRPQGLAFDPQGVLHVADALAGSSGIFAMRPGRSLDLVAGGPGLIGLAFGEGGRLVVASSDSVYGF
jgi:sugar lactone lactonase YvrE